MGEFRCVRQVSKREVKNTINIGIDVHKKKCFATIKDDSRQILEQTSFENTTEQITRFANSIKSRYHTIRAVCESTANYWIRLHDTLEECGIDTILAHPAKTRIIAQAKLKNDKLDSEVLADLLRSDMIYESFVPDTYYRDLRNLVRTRLGLVRTCTTYKNKIHAILAKYEHRCPLKDPFSGKGIVWLRGIELSEIDRMAMNSYLDGIEMLQKQIGTFESRIASISKEDQRIKLLLTIPGISYVTALTVISEIVDISRFATPEKLVAYAGLAPSQRSSGDTKMSGKITKQGSSWLRNAMVEAANITIQHDDRIAKFYSRIASRRGPMKGRVAAAKEMLVIIWHMLTKMEPYRTQNH
jgi:transposase